MARIMRAESSLCARKLTCSQVSRDGRNGQALGRSNDKQNNCLLCALAQCVIASCPPPASRRLHAHKADVVLHTQCLARLAVCDHSAKPLDHQRGVSQSRLRWHAVCARESRESDERKAMPRVGCTDARRLTATGRRQMREKEPRAQWHREATLTGLQVAGCQAGGLALNA